MTASPTPIADCPDDMQLTAYLQGSLADADAWALASHIAECGRCAAVLVETTATIDALRKPTATRRPSRDAVALLAAAALLILAVVTYRSFFTGRSEQAPQQAFARFLNAYAGS